jgi:HPt (histidine-containing phosphotransfer) domain-containing protein
MIDWNRVKDLQEEIGADNFADVVDLFLDEMEMELPKLRQGHGPGDLVAVLHFLKGGALNLGFTDFSDLCLKAELSAAEHGSATVNVQEILGCYDTSRVAFVNGLAKGAADIDAPSIPQGAGQRRTECSD